MKFYTTKEVAEVLSVSEKTIYNWIDQKKIKAYKVGRKWRIDEQDLRVFIEQESNM